MTTKPNNEWENDYHDFYFEQNKYSNREQGFVVCKEYIHSLLSSERQRLREEIEKLDIRDRNFPIDDTWRGYKVALSDILKLLEE